MARYKAIDTSPKSIAVDLATKLLPGAFEHALNHLLGREIDLSGLDARYGNDDTGAPAYPPAVLLKLILSAYSRGIVPRHRQQPPPETRRSARRTLAHRAAR